MACWRLYSVPGCICFGRGLSMSRHVLRYTRRALQIDQEQCRILNKYLSIGSYRLPCFWMNSFHYLILSGIIKWIYFFLLSAVSEVIAGIFFYCKKEIVQNNRQIFKTVLCGKRTRKDSDRFLSSDGLLTKFSEFVCNVTSVTWFLKIILYIPHFLNMYISLENSAKIHLWCLTRVRNFSGAQWKGTRINTLKTSI